MVSGFQALLLSMALRLTDEQWDRTRTHVPEENCPDDRPVRTPVPAQQILEPALWIPDTGAEWDILPQCYPKYKTAHRRFQQWRRNDVLRESGVVDSFECFIDATFPPAKGGGQTIGPNRRERGVTIMGTIDRNCLSHIKCRLQ